MKIPNFREKGTILPTIPEKTEYTVVSWNHSNHDELISSYTNFISFGYKNFNNIHYILCDVENYRGTNYYMIPESIVIDLWKEKNNYKEETMEKISIEKLKADKEYVVYIDSEEEWNELNRLCNFKVTNDFWGKHCYSPKDKTYSSGSSFTNPYSYSYKSQPSKIIRINQIKEYMEKEIIGYKLIKPEYEQAALTLAKMGSNQSWLRNLESQGWIFSVNSINSDTFKEAGVLDLWFEPVYKVEEQVKAGDYLCIIEATTNNENPSYKHYNGSIVKVTNVANDLHSTDSKWISIDSDIFGGGFRMGGNGWIFGKHVRLATPEEIEKSKIKIVSVGGQFNVIVKSTGIFHNNDNITDFVQKMVRIVTSGSFGEYNFTISEINFSKTGCQNKETKLSDWKKVWEEYQQIKK